MGSEEPRSAGSKSYFDVLFVGLICFKRQERVAVMPDGRAPDDPSVQAHYPFLVVDPKDMIKAESSGWDGNDPAHTQQGIYTFSKCTIQITKATTKVGGGPVADQHDAQIPKLVDIDSSFEYATTGASIIATISLGQGTLEVLRRPDHKSQDRGVGSVTRLRVPHNDKTFVTVTVEGEAQPRVLALEPGGDVAIVNGYLAEDPAKTGDPMTLFKKIAKNGTFSVNTPPVLGPSVPVIGENYQVFKINLPIKIADNPGCCPPPN